LLTDVYYLAKLCECCGSLKDLKIQLQVYRSDVPAKSLSEVFGYAEAGMFGLTIALRRMPRHRILVDATFEIDGGPTCLRATGAAPEAVVVSFGEELMRELNNL
jgi:hypothetical protein